MLFAVASALTSGAQAYLGASSQKAQLAAQERVERAQAGAKNRITRAENVFSSVRSNLARFQQSVNNQYLLQAAGEQYEANLVNARREDDALVRSNFAAAIVDSEQRGSMAATAAFSGVAGSVVDAVSSATALRTARATREATLFRDFSNFDAARRGAAIMQQGIRGMDSQLIFTDLDSNVAVAREYAKPNPLRDAVFATVGSLINSAASGAFGVPASKPKPSNTFSFGAPRLGANEHNRGPGSTGIRFGGG